MLFNIIRTKEELEKEMVDLPVKGSMKINIVNKLFTITRYSNGFTLWWGDNYGIDGEDALDIIDKIEMLTSLLIEGKEIECYISAKTRKAMEL